MSDCNFCGAKLEENEMCNCEQAVLDREQAPEKLIEKKKNGFVLSLKVIGQPKEGTVEYVESGRTFSAIILMVIYAALWGGVAWLCSEKIAESINSLVSLVDVSGMKWFGIIFGLTIFSVFAHTCLFLLIYKIFKGPGKFSNMLCLSVLETIPAIPLLGLGVILGTVSVRVMFMMLIAAIISGCTFVLQGMKTDDEKFENKKSYIFIFVYTLVSIIVVMILYEVIASSLEMAVDEILDNFKNGIMNILGGVLF